MAMFTTYIAWALMDRGSPTGRRSSLTLVIAFAGGVAVERS